MPCSAKLPQDSPMPSGESDLVARIAGDEFAILLSPGSTVPYAEQVARRVLAAFALPFSIDGVSAPIGGSIGIASCPSHATGAPGLVRCADLALYQAKRAGRGRWTVFQPEFTTNAEQSLAKGAVARPGVRSPGGVKTEAPDASSQPGWLCQQSFQCCGSRRARDRTCPGRPHPPRSSHALHRRPPGPHRSEL